MTKCDDCDCDCKNRYEELGGENCYLFYPKPKKSTEIETLEQRVNDLEEIVTILVEKLNKVN